MKQLPSLPLTRPDFDIIIEKGQLYVDKTRQILTLLKQGDYLFLSRPRRFGKSMLISTLKALYEGRKELFKNLYIYNKWKWEQYPVIRLDFSLIEYAEGAKVFKQSCFFELNSIAATHDLVITATNFKDSLKEIIRLLHRKYQKKVVILIDEYDKPIVDVLGNKEKAEEQRAIVRQFYTTLKACSSSIEKLIITGVSKFAKISVFSGMNNVKDVTMVPELNDVVGTTSEDLTHYFEGYMQLTEQHLNISRKELLEHIKHWYNGYSWDGVNKIYNPFSINHFFDRKHFKNFWHRSGTPTMLVKLMIEKAEKGELNRKLTDYEQIRVTEEVFEYADLSDADIEGMLFQTGYLTVSAIEMTGFIQEFILDYPNYEVKWSFMANILRAYARIPQPKILPGALKMQRILRTGDLPDFIQHLRSYFAMIPYHLRKKANESYYHSIMHMVMVLIGIDMFSEKPTATGRIDGVIAFEDKVYIIEFKYSRSGTMVDLLNTAMNQIKTKDYAAAYRSSGKAVHLVGVGFLDVAEAETGKQKLQIEGCFEQY